MSSQEVLAYLAGVIDSDGCIGVKRNTYAMRVTKDCLAATYSERIHIRQVTREALELMATTFGGNIGIEDPNAKRGKPLFTWGQTDIKAATTLSVLLPYLRIKRKQAVNCLRLRNLKDASKVDRVRVGRGHVGSAPRNVSYSASMEACYIEAKRLNQVGVKQ